MKPRHSHIWRVQYRHPPKKDGSQRVYLTCQTCLKTKEKILKPKPKRKAINPMSDSKRRFTATYRALKEADHDFQTCPKCGHGDHKSKMSPHHPFGRIKERLLRYLWTCQTCHDWIHANGKEAREQGWLQPEFDGRPPREDVQKPWEKLEIKI